MVFVQEPKYPQNDKERLAVVKRMTAHANYALSGDTTLAAIQTAVRDVVKQEAGTGERAAEREHHHGAGGAHTLMRARAATPPCP